MLADFVADVGVLRMQLSERVAVGVEVAGVMGHPQPCQILYVRSTLPSDSPL